MLNMLDEKTAHALRLLADEYQNVLLCCIPPLLDETVASSFRCAARETTGAAQSICCILGLSIDWRMPRVEKATPWAEAVALLTPDKAQHLSERLVAISEGLTNTYRLIPVCEETDELRSVLRRWLGLLYTDILRDIWAHHPDLLPAEMKRRR